MASLTASIRRLAVPPVRAALARLGYEVHRGTCTAKVPVVDDDFPIDFDEDARRLFRRVQPYTLTGKERVFALREAIRYISRARIEGAIAECGVWRGGSVLVIALTLVEMKDTDRHLYLY